MIERNEIEILSQKGLRFQNSFDVISYFEERVAAYMGAKHAVAVDCCTHALELSLRYLGATGVIRVPKRTYLSVPMTVLKLGCQIEWVDSNWNEFYRLDPFPVLDASLCFKPNSYQEGNFMCLSFHFKKTLPIGRGGMILTSDEGAAKWLRKASYDGRSRDRLWKEDPIEMIGYHYYMTPEDAARGLLLMEELSQRSYKTGGAVDYPDVSTLEVFKLHGD